MKSLTVPKMQQEDCLGHAENTSNRIQSRLGKDTEASEMPYLNGVMYEALRLWPPVPFDPKMAFEDDVLPGGCLAETG